MTIVTSETKHGPESNSHEQAPAGDQSDLLRKSREETDPKKAPRQILKHEIKEGLHALKRSAGALFLSALSGGLDLGFSLFLMAIALTRMDGSLPGIVEELIIANMYAIGFIFVVIGRSELFTEQTTLAVLPVLNGRASVGGLLRLWGIVFCGNLMGACGFAALAAWVGPALGVIEPHAFGVIAQRLTDHGSQSIFTGAVLAGWLMGLLSWLVAAGRDTIGQIVLVWLITTAIGFAGLPHAILGTVEVLAGIFAGQSVGLPDFGRFLLWATLGNIVGGSVFVALIKYGHARPETAPA